MKDLSISEVAKASNVNITTVRYYERCGLIPEPPRTESGYRKFPLEIVERIKFIKRSQELGFTLSEIKKLLLISDNDKKFDSEEILQFTNNKIKEIESKIKDLKKIKFLLEELSKQCLGSGNPICDILPLMN
ncbi:MAG: hypothetical protein PWP45_1865 [Tepidanaerobacteraceae bacterium]|nr:hypothetical protein [Tepidanaerobacteraceae bacterium]